LIPKSSVGPAEDETQLWFERRIDRLTSWVVARSQQNPTSGFPHPNDVASCWGAENAILADD
jgi:hypothetical protein